MDMCAHLKPIEDYLKKAGYTEIYRGQPWSKNCREWIYFDEVLDPIELIKTFNLNKSISIHNYADNKVGAEFGLVCTICKDAIIGRHPNNSN